MEDRTRTFAAGLAGVDAVYFGMAQVLASEEDEGTWKDYTFSQEYPVETKQGKHPSTFGSFLEGFSFDLREMGYDISRGELAEMLETFRWFVEMGGSQQHWSFLGYALLKRLRRQKATKEVVSDALNIKQTFGKYHLPSFAPEGKVSFSFETEDMGDGTYQIRSLVITKDGNRYVNRWPKELLHYACKRLRASNITRDAH